MRHIYSGHEFGDDGSYSVETLGKEFGRREYVFLRQSKNANAGDGYWSSLPVLGHIDNAPYPLRKIVVRRKNDAIGKAICRHYRKQAKHLSFAERGIAANKYLASVDRKLIPHQTVSLESFLSDVFAFPTVAKQSQAINRKPPVRKRAKKGSCPAIHRREVGREGTQAVAIKRRKRKADHSTGKNANLIRHGYDDAKQNAIVWCLENGHPPETVLYQVYVAHKLAWRIGWRRHAKSVKFAQTRERTFSSDIDTLERVAEKAKSSLSHATLRTLCRLAGRDKRTRLVTYLFLIGEKQQAIADRLQVSLSTVEKSIKAMRRSFDRAGDHTISDILKIS